MRRALGRVFSEEVMLGMSIYKIQPKRTAQGPEEKGSAVPSLLCLPRTMMIGISKQAASWGRLLTFLLTMANFPIHCPDI